MRDDLGDDTAGGDPVCWLAELCPECGAMPTDEPRDEPADDPAVQPGRCWRCGADLARRDAET